MTANTDESKSQEAKVGQDGSGRKEYGPVSVAQLRQAAIDGDLDPGVKGLREAELEYIKKKRKYYGQKREETKGNDLAGLALSGGGIRSATFALGVMQALARDGVLKHMDYLSTVSGGGYIGSALTWFLGPQNKDGKFGLEKDNFPWGIDAGRESEPLQRKMLDWLRQHGKYLTPGKGITLMSGIAVVLRGIVLNLLVWIPVGIAAFLLLFRLGDWIAGLLKGRSGAIGWLIDLLSAVRIPAAFSAADGLVLATLFIATAILLVLAAGAVVYSLITWICISWGPLRYGFRRWAETIAAKGFWIALGCVVLASIPIAGALLEGWVAAAGGPVSALAGIVTGVWGFMRTLRDGPKPIVGMVAGVGAALLIYGLALICFRYAAALDTLPPSADWTTFLVFLAVAIGTGILVNINYISVHLFYRDRLMEAYLPDAKAAEAGETGAAHIANGTELNDVLVDGSPVAPFHIINANVVLVNAEDPRRRLRGGDNFILTPRYCGSSATGWTRTDFLIKGKFTLPTAMAISGAAANPNAGSGGVGVTRSRAVSLLMALLNLRLGYWIPHPSRGWRYISPNHFVPGLAQALGDRFGFHRENAPIIEISDGGHFENLALYELIRRRLKLIIVCDGACDPKFGFSDLNSLRRRIAADFGARIHFDIDGTPQDLIPARLKSSFPDDAGYATKGDMAERGFIIGRITYSNGDPGVLIYIKTTMVDSVSFGVKAYKGAHHDFPDETTADQFFDEEQFDAYRELGNHLATEMLQRTELAGNIGRIIESGAWHGPTNGPVPSP